MTQAMDCAYSVEGSGPPLFLIHGIGAARDAWRFMLPILARKFTVVTYDLRGHGASPIPEKEFGLDELVADLEQVRVQTGFEKAHFAGHSLGGMTVLRALRLDRRIRAGVSLSPGEQRFDDPPNRRPSPFLTPHE